MREDFKDKNVIHINLLNDTVFQFVESFVQQLRRIRRRLMKYNISVTFYKSKNIHFFHILLEI